MEHLILFEKSTLDKFLNKRSGETKFGEYVQLLPNICNIYDQLKDLDVEFVILGIPEDVGEFANHGKSGTSRAWEASIKLLLNNQSNRFCDPKKTLILGEIDCRDEMKQLQS